MCGSAVLLAAGACGPVGGRPRAGTAASHSPAAHPPPCARTPAAAETCGARWTCATGTAPSSVKLRQTPSCEPTARGACVLGSRPRAGRPSCGSRSERHRLACLPPAGPTNNKGFPPSFLPAAGIFMTTPGWSPCWKCCAPPARSCSWQVPFACVAFFHFCGERSAWWQRAQRQSLVLHCVASMLPSRAPLRPVCVFDGAHSAQATNSLWDYTNVVGAS